MHLYELAFIALCDASGGCRYAFEAVVTLLALHFRRDTIQTHELVFDYWNSWDLDVDIRTQALTGTAC